MALIFKNADEVKNSIMASQKKEIADLYEKWADEIGDKAYYYAMKTNASAPLSERYYKELQKQLRATSQNISNEIYSKIKNNMYTISDAVVKDNIKWLESLGFSEKGLNAAFSYVPDEVVRNLITGQIYDSGWSLSSRIWGDNEATLKDIYQVMAKGLAENKPIYQIAKDLEAYVRPSAQLPWNLRMADGVKIYKKQVDYNAQRLARTLAQHSYQQSFIATTQKNPFITEYIWRSNGSRVCELCMSRDGKHFKKDELPMDHPNGMCTMEPAVAEDMVDQLADWFNSPDGTYPEIDEFAGNFGYQASKDGTLSDYISKYGKSDKSWGAYVKSLSPVQKAEAKMLKDKAGMSWQQWYETNIYTGTGPSANYKTKTTKINKIAEDYLTKAGFGKSAMPENFKSFDEWYYSNDVSYESLVKLSKMLGSNGDYADATLLKKFFDGNFIGNTAKKLNLSDDALALTTNVKTKINNVSKFDKNSWDDMIAAQRDRSFLTKMRQSEDSWESLLSEAEIKSVYKYTQENGTNCYIQQNGFLRFGQDVSPTVKSTIKNIKSALDKGITTEDMMLVRGTKKKLYTDIFQGELKKAFDSGNLDAMVGEVFKDPGFLSTSPNGSDFSGDLKFKIFAPAGTKGGYVENNNAFGEKEFLVQSNTSYFIEKAERDNYGDIVLYLRIIV